MQRELGAVCIMSSIKRDQSWRGAVEFLYSLQMIHRHHCTAWRGLAEKWEEGLRCEAWVVWGWEVFCLVCQHAVNQNLPHLACFMLQMWIIPFSLKAITSGLRLCLCLFPSFWLKHQIMNSLLRQGATRTECTFKFKLMTHNLHPHSREL